MKGLMLHAISAHDLAQLAERDPRYGTDQLFTEMALRCAGRKGDGCNGSPQTGALNVTGIKPAGRLNGAHLDTGT